jgi:hypothetical protein
MLAMTGHVMAVPAGWCCRPGARRREPGVAGTSEDEATEVTMTTTTGGSTNNLDGKPPVVNQAAWHAARDELLVREKAHTREGDAIAAARRRLPMVEFDGTVEVIGADGRVPFLHLFEGRDEPSSTSTCGTTAPRPKGSVRAAP